MNTYGYIRVSTKEQNGDRKLVAMSAFGVTAAGGKTKSRERPCYQEHRPAGAELCGALRPGGG